MACHGLSSRRLKELQPAPPRRLAPPFLTPEESRSSSSFLDLPPELRVAIYQLVLKDVIIHILPLKATEQCYPHPLLHTNHQIRSEVQPVIHESCSIRASVTDFDFSGLLAWLDRMPPECHKHLHKNANLSISLCMTPEVHGDLPSLRRWLHDRADPHRAQGAWKYSGPTPSPQLKSDLKRRVRRMKEKRKQIELRKMVTSIGVTIYDNELK